MISVQYLWLLAKGALGGRSSPFGEWYDVLVLLEHVTEFFHRDAAFVEEVGLDK